MRTTDNYCGDPRCQLCRSDAWPGLIPHDRDDIASGNVWPEEDDDDA